MSRSVVIRRCATVEEALVVQALLQDAGFAASLENYHHATNDWFLVSALEGVSIRVPESQLIKAGQFMLDAVETADERLEDATGPLDKTPLTHRRFRALTMIFVFFGGPSIFFFLMLYIAQFLPIEYQARQSGFTYPPLIDEPVTNWEFYEGNMLPPPPIRPPKPIEEYSSDRSISIISLEGMILFWALISFFARQQKIRRKRLQ